MKLSYTPLKNDRAQDDAATRRRSFARQAIVAGSLALSAAACSTTENYYYNTTVEAPQQQPTESDSCPPPVASLSCKAPRILTRLEDGQSIRIGESLVSFEGDSDFNGTVVMKVSDRNCQLKGQGNAAINEPMAVEGTPDGITLTVTDAEAASVEVEVSLPLIMAGFLNLGEALVLSPTESLRLDDISTSPSTEPPSALLSVLTKVGTEQITVYMLDVGEGKAEPFTVGGAKRSVGAPVVSPGATFSANRAELEVFSCEE